MHCGLLEPEPVLATLVRAEMPGLPRQTAWTGLRVRDVGTWWGCTVSGQRDPVNVFQGKARRTRHLRDLRGSSVTEPASGGCLLKGSRAPGQERLCLSPAADSSGREEPGNKGR